MTFDKFYQILKQANISQKKLKSRKRLNPPYMVVCEGSYKTDGADGKILFKEHNPRIELYTNESDSTSAGILENVLTRSNISFEASEETQISDEGIYVKYYDIQSQFEFI